MRFLWFFFLLLSCASPPEIAVSQLNQEVGQLTQDFREAQGLSSLEVLPELSEVALRHSQNMREQDFFDHVDPEGRTPFDRLQAQLPTYFIVTSGENLALQSQDGMNASELAGHLLQLWQDSPEHRLQLTGADYRHLGVGITRTENNVFYATQVFAAVLARLLTPIPETVSTEKPLTLRFQFYDAFPRTELTAFVHTSQGFARIEGPNGRFYRGKGPVPIRWSDDHHFSIDVPTQLGRGQYRLRLGRGARFFEKDYIIRAE